MWNLALLAACLTLVSFSILKMEVICSSETSVDFQRTTRHYIPEDRSLQLFNIDLSVVLRIQQLKVETRTPYYTLHMPLMSYSN
jgi:hypothetical protein